MSVVHTAYITYIHTLLHHGQSLLKCRLGCDTNETQSHLLDCVALTDPNIVKELLEHDDLYGEDIAKIETISKILQMKFKLLTELHEENQVNGSSKSCSASTINVLNVSHLNIDVDDLD